MSDSKRILFASPNHWRSTFQVGSHNLAREFARRGWQVAFVSDPISPLHFAQGSSPDLTKRTASWRAGGEVDCDGRLWSYVPAALLTPHNKPLLRSDAVHRRWQNWTWPNLPRLVRNHGFGDVDILYIDSTQQTFWLDAVNARRSVYRVADYNPHFAKYTPATERLERQLAQRVDLVVHPSRQLERYARDLGARRTMLLANGVDLEHYLEPRPKPVEYERLRGPIAVYMGVIPEWFHFDWIRAAARNIPEMTFVLIGPDAIAARELGGLANVLALGTREYAAIPGYLQHASVGLMPFDGSKNPAGVAALNPQKMYAYFASGIPVVSSTWEEIAGSNPPARLCATETDFISGLRQTVDHPPDSASLRQFASGFSWRDRVTTLLAALENEPRTK